MRKIELYSQITSKITCPFASLKYSHSVNFDSIAPHYHTIEKLSFGNTLQATRVSLLEKAVIRLDASSKILLIGDGDGRFCEQLLSKTTAHIDYVEHSTEMIHQARFRLQKTKQIHFHCVDIRDWKTSGYDLIISHFVLDCFSEKERRKIILNLIDKLTPRGRWLISDFNPEVGLWAKAVTWGMYFFFKCTSQLPMHQLRMYAPLIEKNGMRLTHQHIKWRGFIYSNLWQVFPSP